MDSPTECSTYDRRCQSTTNEVESKGESKSQEEPGGEHEGVDSA